MSILHRAGIDLAEEFRELALTAYEQLQHSLRHSDGLSEFYEAQILRYSALATMEYKRYELRRNRPIVTQVGRPSLDAKEGST